jgi:thymidylate kinase
VSRISAASRRSPGRFVSYDDALLSKEFSLVGILREAFARTTVTTTGSAYSPEFLTILFHAYIVFLRDRILASDCATPIIVDSYYYKILAKCRLARFVNDTVFGWWRSFPQPAHVIYLDVDIDEAWSRSGEGKSLNALEYYGDTPTRAGFERFQSDLQAAMLREVEGLDLKRLRLSGNLHNVANTIEKIIVPETTRSGGPMTEHSIFNGAYGALSTPAPRQIKKIRRTARRLTRKR